MEEPISRASAKAAGAARPATPVFLDATGRRARRLRAATSVGALSVVLTFAVVCASLTGAPTIMSPLLPAPAETSEVDASEQRSAAAPAPRSTPVVTPAPAPSETVAPPVAPPATAPVATPAPVPSPSPTATPAPVPAPTPPAEADDAPGNSGSAPGRAKTPTPPSKP